MYISKFQLFHYKSFLESGTLEFKPGINLITGQNNSGKSALLQALTLEFSNIPHLSPKTLTTPKSNQTLKISSAKVSLLLEKYELKSILEDYIQKGYPDKNSIDSAADEALIKERGARGFREWLDTPGEVELSLSFDAATPSKIETEPSKISRHAVEFVFNQFKKRIFRFRAERLKLESSPYGDSEQLTSDASNLAQCLSKLQGNRKKFERFNNYVSVILPQIKSISVTNKGSNFEIMVWPIDTEIDELAFPLSACGTGIGQVLAILYVVLTSHDWRTIIIDEPQSFLHPGAEKKLVEILKEFPQHQYFIATHSPTIIANANPSTIVMLRSQDCETVASVMNAEDRKELGNLMDELGVKLSDVFGADNILWVESPTEEACFRKILETKRPLRGTTILAVNSTGYFEQKDYRSAEIIFKIYEKVSGKESLFPPAIGFIFDKEDRGNNKIEDMKRRSDERLKFLPRRMYENYLLHPEAIAHVINQEDKEEQQQPLSGANIQEWINQNKHNESYFPKNNSANWVRTLINNQQIDFIVIDEIHYTKQRQVEDISKRKQLVSALITAAAERNPDLHIIGMSATPVINNLQEGKSLVELVTGVHHNELDIRPTLPNCMKLHQRLVTLGIRWMPDYKQQLGEPKDLSIPVDCSEFIDEIRALGRKGTHLALEQILTRARLPVIREQIKPKTLIYTHYIQGIDKLLRDALIEDGWNVGFYTGEDKSGLEGFLYGNIDVLIGSNAIATGVDGLQQVCNRLILNVLPWTHAEFEQLIGRIYRQGQQNPVTIVIPLTYAHINGDRWSWCDSKMQRLRFKKSIADAAVDGIVPEGHLRTAAQAYQDIIAWLERLETGQVETIARPKIIIPLPDDDPADVQRRQHRYGDFSTLNHLWNQSRSETTHQRLQANPEEWAQYHTLYQESRKTWSVIPYEEMIRWCQQRSGYAIADFGCGEAKLAEAVSDRHTVYSFDHIAINNNVVACDMAHVPINDEELDVAIFSLSLMGSNFTDYLREAHRTLKLDGQLHIIEATSRFSNIAQFQTDLEALGFDVVRVREMWKFTHIRAIKTEQRPQDGIELRF